MLKILVLLIIFTCISVASSEYIPVYMWENVQEESDDSLLVSPLQKINQANFQSMISKKLRNNNLVLIFVEESLSTEDFMLHGANGKTAFPFLSGLVDQFKISYLPNVEDPLKILTETLKDPPTSTSFGNMDLDKSKIVIYNLNSSIEATRVKMFTRHDLTMSKVFMNFLKLYDNILAILTARHAHSRIHHLSKKLLQTIENSNKPNIIVDDKNLLLVTSGDAMFSKDNGKTFSTISLSRSDFSINDKVIKLTLSGENLSVKISIKIFARYWKVETITMNDKKIIIEEIAPPLNFSYHCSNFTLRYKKEKQVLKIPGFQIQPFKGTEEKKAKFGAAYDCTGYTTVPILSGILVCTLFLTILFHGIISMMDIRVMDRFEDPKGKPFYVVVEQ